MVAVKLCSGSSLMAFIHLDQVSLTYPMLGAGSRNLVTKTALVGAGNVLKDKKQRSSGIVALSDISLKIEVGDRVGLVGRNGSGKSTLLRVMAGIYEPLEGRVHVEGTIASLFSLGLGTKTEANGYRNIELAGLMAGYSRDQIDEKLPAIAEFTGLGQYLNMPVRTYSNGMAMRLKFACGTAFSPEVLLMDEWLGAGDPSFQKKASDKMAELVEQAGILVLASHNHQLIKNSCNKVIWLDRGEMKLFGPVDEVLEQVDD